jgi:adenylate cyclase
MPVPKVERGVHVQVLGANVVGALVLCLYTVALPSRGRRGPLTNDALSLVVLILYLAITLPTGSLIARRLFAPLADWFEDEHAGPLDAAGQRVALRVPATVAVISFVFWAGAAVLFGALNLRFDPSGYQTLRTALSVVLAGLVTCSLVYLLAERAMRPVFAKALAGEPPARPVTLGIRPRLVLAWALGSGVFLLGVVLGPLGLPRSKWADLVLPLAVLAGMGLVIGGLLVDGTARAIADPLEELRAALGRVDGGDLEVHVTVDDGGELGMLQSGLNHTVARLRERRRLEELFGRHVGVAVARKALEQGVALGGERTEASMLFVDLVGSTAFADSHAPETVVRALNAFFGVVVRTVHAEGGWVNKFEGDAALCVFGVPAGPADHAARALRAARTLRRELLALAAEQPGLDAGIGVSAGTVVAGNIGAEARYEYTVVGHPVNEAARLTEEAKSRLGRVLASEEVVERAGTEAAGWAVADELHLRGAALPVLVYEPRLASDREPADR